VALSMVPATLAPKNRVGRLGCLLGRLNGIRVFCCSINNWIKNSYGTETIALPNCLQINNLISNQHTLSHFRIFLNCHTIAQRCISATLLQFCNSVTPGQQCYNFATLQVWLVCNSVTTLLHFECSSFVPTLFSSGTKQEQKRYRPPTVFPSLSCPLCPFWG